MKVSVPVLLVVLESSRSFKLQLGLCWKFTASGRPINLSKEEKALIDQQVQKNDEMTSSQVQKKLEKQWNFCMFSHRVKNEKEAWLDSKEDGTLSVHPSPKQDEMTGVCSACVGKWRHF